MKVLLVLEIVSTTFREGAVMLEIIVGAVRPILARANRRRPTAFIATVRIGGKVLQRFSQRVRVGMSPTLFVRKRKRSRGDYCFCCVSTDQCDAQGEIEGR